MSSTIIAERVFGEADQTWFAAVSGDRNPMHMDALVARRTMAGFPVVHGIHTLLWALDQICATTADWPPIAALKVNFEKMIYLGDVVRAVVTDRNAAGLHLDVTIGGVTVLGLDMEFGAPRDEAESLSEGPWHQPTEPDDLTFDAMVARRGLIGLPEQAADIAAVFPTVTAVLGTERVAALAASSYLVGMVCPGLHSIYRSLQLTTVAVTPQHCDRLHFQVKYSDEDYRFIRLAVAGAGWAGLIDTNARPEPTVQAAMTAIVAKLTPGEFAGVSALIVGGSRGLGEVVAKILTAGGAHVTVTYAVGEADARRLQAEIVGAGGRCGIMRYNVREPSAGQIARLETVPNAMYFMATPAIFQRPGAVFSTSRLQDYLAFYVTGFSDLCDALREQAGSDMAIFYPSSVSIEERPANMTEYTMAKAAGEILCADMEAFGKWRRVLVRRLPRLPTDQTATLLEDESDDPVEAMLPIVRDLHAG